MNRPEALKLLHQYIKNENLRKHCLASGRTQILRINTDL